ncbi:MAG: biotin/lipoate A/B protein ligase family protein [Thermoanaerobaculales bacterium]
MRWRLLDDGAHPGAWNMAVDEAIGEAVDAGAAPPTLRLYRWDPACLSLGFSQPHEVADARFCAAHAIGVVRRPTGGRAVLHHLELTYAVAARLDAAPFSPDLQAAYQAICRALVAGLATLGVRAELSGVPNGGNIRPTQPIPCFIGPAAGEVVVGSRKLVGSAMRRVGNAILQHGSILEGWDGALQAGCLGLPDDRELRPAVVTLGELLGTALAREALARAIARGFEARFEIALKPAALTAGEGARATVLERERYGHERFTIHRDRSLSAQ